MEYKDYEVIIKDLLNKKSSATDEKEKEILKGETVEYVYSSLKEDYYQI